MSTAVCTGRDIAITAILTSSNPSHTSSTTTMATAPLRTSPAVCGIGASLGKGLGIAINDFDQDGWPDVFVANDSSPEQLFRNNRNGTFTEVGLSSGVAYDQNGKVFAGMGADFADYDNDGWPDIFVNALANQKYALFRNDKRLFRRRD